MPTRAYQIEYGESLPYNVDTFKGETALPAARGTFERLKAENRSVRLTSGYIDSETQEYTATHLLEEYFRKPYTCSECGKNLAFPEAFTYHGHTYCSEHLPRYDKHEQF